MTEPITLTTKNVEGAHSLVVEGIIYVNYELKKTMHMCPCLNHVVSIPMNENGWIFKRAGSLNTIEPSIRNTPCGKHYNITDNKIVVHNDSK